MKRKRDYKAKENPTKKLKTYHVPDYLVENSSDEDISQEEAKKTNEIKTVQSKDERRINRNKEYLNNIKKLINLYGTKSKAKRKNDFVSDDNDSDNDEFEHDEDDSIDPILEKVKEDIFKSKNLIMNDYVEKFKELNFSNETLTRHKLQRTPISPKKHKTRINFWKGHHKSVTGIALSQSHENVYSVSKDKCFLKWNLRKNCVESKKVFKNFTKKNLLSVATSHDDRYVCFGGGSNVIYVFDTRSDEIINELSGHSKSITGLSFKHKSYELYSSSMDKTLKYWDVKKEVLYQNLYGHVSDIMDVHNLHEDNLVSCGIDMSVRLWNIEKQKQFIFQSTSTLDVVRMIHKDAFITGAQDGSISLWSTMKKTPLKVFNNAHGGEWICSLNVIPYSNVFASGSCDGEVKLWHASISECDISIINAININGYINGIEFARNMKFMVVGVGNEHRLGRWNVLKGNKNGIAIINLKDSLEDNINNVNDSEE